MIVVVGSYNVDFLIKVRDFPSEGETVFSDGVYIDHGGKGSNQAVSASRLGGNVRLISAVGNDEFGKRAIKFWEDERLDVAYVKIKNALTGSAYIVFDRRGRNFIVVNRGANALLSEDDLDGCLNGDILLTQLEVNENVVKKALKEFPGVKVLNPAPAVLNDNSLLEYVDILTPNEIEFKELTGTQDLNYGIDLLLKKVKRAVIVTLGERGAYIGTRERRILIPTLAVDAIDTTGAGDVFNASLAVYLEKGYSLERAVRISNIISAYSTTRIGALGPRLSEVSELIEKE
ncbi:PfkB family carbohydrate kinase [Sulfolobus acidocaldarius]|uniref:Ribokinase n=4 Tax=Sulfolobus acidocaldarius TaxID=2285 RepID=Q4JBZ1_SULAC|nr:PfkB family carbohydrate kinase [Sulfolobus acidocaldarius]AAY79688.1 ribokinase [Sulfolobus acidocaldarius DSM 639]AGE70247.1 ribokinase [Sulfolobus acidocaldarius N8]AGE72522.1 ribokinase [Sulfolobus acidocaldarius Ron12/I]ALU29348.1 ribokinase [Sulfolobus acidocaldarius]ALU32077.1 ribokinase [Sulfolobus acidocaldarius]